MVKRKERGLDCVNDKKSNRRSLYSYRVKVQDENKIGREDLDAWGLRAVARDKRGTGGDRKKRNGRNCANEKTSSRGKRAFFKCYQVNT